MIYKEIYKEWADGYVIYNLKEYGNSFVPPETIEFFGNQKETARFLTFLLGEPVSIKKSVDVGYIAERVML